VNEKKCPVCKVICGGALWCPLASDDRCPLTTNAQPTEAQKEMLGMNDSGTAMRGQAG